MSCPISSELGDEDAGSQPQLALQALRRKHQAQTSAWMRRMSAQARMLISLEAALSDGVSGATDSAARTDLFGAASSQSSHRSGSLVEHAIEIASTLSFYSR